MLTNGVSLKFAVCMYVIFVLCNVCAYTLMVMDVCVQNI